MVRRLKHLILPEHVRAQILDHARQTLKQECCGLLIGSGENVVKIEEIVRTANRAIDPARRFEIDPQVQFDQLRRLRGSTQRMVGHYHSHPDGPCAPSAYDLSMAHDPEAIWVIAVLRPAETLAAFTCPDRSQGFQPLEIAQPT
jgi:proteasome lid subunit RPN8/RPN11